MEKIIKCRKGKLYTCNPWHRKDGTCTSPHYCKHKVDPDQQKADNETKELLKRTRTKVPPKPDPAQLEARRQGFIDRGIRRKIAEENARKEREQKLQNQQEKSLAQKAKKEASDLQITRYALGVDPMPENTNKVAFAILGERVARRKKEIEAHAKALADHEELVRNEAHFRAKVKAALG